MTRELDRSEWKEFFEGISRNLADWETTIHVLNQGSGAQILSQGLPFNGLTFEEKRGKRMVELSVGSATANHQTHNIANPTKVAFAGRGSGPAGTLDIEDASGTTTLITFIQPRRSLIEYGRTDMIAI